jgi:hypothetical protein
MATHLFYLSPIKSKWHALCRIALRTLIDCLQVLCLARQCPGGLYFLFS